MREGSRQKTRGLMADNAVLARWYMVAEFAYRCGSVMADTAVVHYILVIKIGLGKSCRYVTHRAILRGRYMRRICFRIHSGCRDAVMTGGAVVNNPGVIKHRSRKGARYMT